MVMDYLKLIIDTIARLSSCCTRLSQPTKVT